MSKSRVWFFAALFAYALVCRLLPYVLGSFGMTLDPSQSWYPWNFSPLMAVSLFGGACAAERRWSIALPLLVMFLSDIGIWGLTGRWDWAFPPSQPLIYACFASAAVLGWLIRSRPRVITSLPLAIGAESVFFLVSNFAVWWFGEGSSYPPTMNGLLLCYTVGLPFFGRSLVSTWLYCSVLFSPVGLRLADAEHVDVEPAEAQG